MARWRLTQPHYLNTIPPTKWRYEETDRDTGERNVVEFDVCRLLDPNNPRDCRSQGDCVVVDKPEFATRGDWTFVGEPTPDMEPLDEAAERITESFRHKWQAPMSEGAFPAQGGFGGALLAQFEKQLTEAFAKSGPIAPMSTQGVPLDQFQALQEQVAKLMAQNAELQAQKPEVEAPAKTGTNRR